MLYSAPMVRANRERRKTQTRRLIKARPVLQSVYTNKGSEPTWVYFHTEKHGGVLVVDMPRLAPIQPGDVIWQRETFGCTFNTNREDGWPGRDCTFLDEEEPQEAYIYRADGEWLWTDEDGFENGRSYWKPSLFMPYAACRNWYEVTEVRAERLQDISEADAIAEGIEIQEGRYKNYLTGQFEFSSSVGFVDEAYGKNLPAAVISYATLFDSINGVGSWAANPFVWAYTYNPTEKPVTPKP